MDNTAALAIQKKIGETLEVPTEGYGYVESSVGPPRMHWWGFGRKDDKPRQDWCSVEWKYWALRVESEPVVKTPVQSSTKVSTVEVVIGWSVSAIILLVVLVGIYVNAL